MDADELIMTLKDNGSTWAEIQEAYNAVFPHKTVSAIRHRYDRVIRPRLKARSPGTTVTGIIGDLHAPFNHPNYLRFCKDTFDRFGATRYVCIGDIVDHHAISRFNAEPNARGAYDELDRAIEQVHNATSLFPTAKMCIGNHDAIPERQAATLGIGDRYLKSYHELLGLPKTWEIADEFIIDDVLYRHGINCLGKNGALNAAIQERMSLVMGHAHSFGGCNYAANKRSIIFGLNVGCGIDVDAYAFAYGKYDKLRPTLGCGIVFNSGYAIFVPMGAEYFRSAKK